MREKVQAYSTVEEEDTDDTDKGHSRVTRDDSKSKERTAQNQKLKIE